MTRNIIVIILLVAMVFLLCGCDNVHLEKKTSNTKAYIKMNEKIIVIDIDAYDTSRSNGSIYLYGIDGKTYETHLVNVVLVTDTDRR